jgi:hypothetical protein
MKFSEQLRTERLYLHPLRRRNLWFFCKLIGNKRVRRYLGGPVDSRKEIGTLINGEETTTKSLPVATVDPKLVQKTLAKLTRVHNSEAAPRYSTGAFDGLDKQVQVQALAQGIGFGK